MVSEVPIELVARLLGDSLSGIRPPDPEQPRLLRQLRGRLEVWAAARPQDQTSWNAVQASPRTQTSELADLLKGLSRDDPEARPLISKLSPDRPELRFHYLDFSIAIEEAGKGKLLARALAVPCGERSVVELDLSFCEDRPIFIVDSFARQLRRFRDVRRRNSPSAFQQPNELGRKLSSAIFAGGLEKAWLESKGLLSGRPELGLRLRLTFDLGSDLVRSVAALPWELIGDPSTGQILSKNIRTPVVRTLETSGASVAPRDPSARDILLVLSQPRDQAKLDLAGEKRAIRDAWRTVPGVHVEDTVADLADLRELLRSKKFRVLHFMGHGGFDSTWQEGMLVFENPAGESRSVYAGELAEQLSGIPLELVVLSSCQSGELPRKKGLEPFAGVAAALLRSGQRAVVAMQYPISDEAAIEFGRSLYQRLALRDSLEPAVTEGRLAIARAFPGSFEWATPVLYLR